MDFSEIPVEIKADIDISKEQWTPIGTWENPYHGTFNGNNHTIKGLNRSSADNDSIYSTGETTKIKGNVFGLFGITGNGNVTISNLKLSAVKIDLKVGTQVGALIGYAPNNRKFTGENKWKNNTNIGKDDLVVSNIIVDGEIYGEYSIGGVIGRIYAEGKVNVTNCINNASVIGTGSNGQIAGIVGYICYPSEIALTSNINNGTIKSKKTIAGIATIGNDNTSTTIKSNNNVGDLYTPLENDNVDFGYIVSGTSFSSDVKDKINKDNTNTGNYNKLNKE